MDEIFLAYAGLLTLATVAIYAGAWGSLPPSRKAASITTKEAVEDEDEDEEDLDERLSSSDAYLFPILASAALLGLYLVFKYLGTEWVNWFLGWYFALMGVGSVWKTSAALLRRVLGRAQWRTYDRTKFYLVKGQRELFSLSFRTPTAFLFPLALLPSVVYMLAADKKPALMTNILGISFAYNALCLLKLDSFQTGTILLGGLFIYDIWWVFGTEVMVKVATTLDAPIKILWPKSADFSTAKGFTMLGLGDIVIPGAFVTLALRRDLFASPTRDPNALFAKPYFTSAIIAYVLGLVSTMTVMHTLKTAQPALLYLSPACILSFLLTAMIRGELKEVWGWKDEPMEKSDKSEPPDLKVREPVAQANGEAPVTVNVIEGSTAGPEQIVEGGDEEGGEDDKPKKKRSSRKKR